MVEDGQPSGLGYGHLQQRTWGFPSKDPFSCYSWTFKWHHRHVDFWHPDVMNLSRLPGTSMILKEEDLARASPLMWMPHTAPSGKGASSSDLWPGLTVSVCWRAILSPGAVLMHFWRNHVALGQRKVTARAKLSTWRDQSGASPPSSRLCHFKFHTVAHLRFSFFPFSLRASRTLGTCPVTELYPSLHYVFIIR